MDNLDQSELNRLAKLFAQLAGREPDENTKQYIREAQALIYNFCGSQSVNVPEPLLTQAILIVTREIETREKSPGGIFAAFGEQDGAVRLARDPMTMAYPLLRPFLGGGFA
ncbi:hypothetical protein RQN30_10700 [Arcanobacterium hippocoleae]